MKSLPLGLLHAPSTGEGVNLSWLPDNEAILKQLPDVLACKERATKPFK